jgi:steroid delta-isomerase-like uncharacterized protein
MSVEENVRLLERWFQEVWNENKIETIHELIAPNPIAVGQLEGGKELRSGADFEAFVRGIRDVFPEIKMVVKDVFGAEDRVALRWAAEMTHNGSYMGMAPTGKVVHLTGITIARIREGKIVEGWDSWDQLGMLQQIGAYEESPAALLKSA